MGATNFSVVGLGKDVRSVFEDLVGDAKYEYGNDRYNGTISTCSLGRCTQKYDKPTKTNENKAIDHIERRSYGQKRVADYIDLGVVEYKVITYKKEISKDNPSYKLQYVVKEGISWLESDHVFIKAFETKTIADDYALELAMKYSNKEYFVTKEYVLVKGKATITGFKKEVKVYKSKPNLKPMKNRVIVPIHKYIFYGWAAI